MFAEVAAAAMARRLARTLRWQMPFDCVAYCIGRDTGKVSCTTSPHRHSVWGESDRMANSALSQTEREREGARGRLWMRVVACQPTRARARAHERMNEFWLRDRFSHS